MKNNITIPAYLFLGLLLSSLVFSCNERPAPKPNPNSKELKETMMKVNKNLVESENRDIEQYIKRYGWEMKETGTGLRYMIYKHGVGEKAAFGKIAKLNYKVGLLDGTQCYSSDENGPKVFRIGKGGVESGLEEGVLFLHVGDRAKFILPSHLAFGLVGDSKKIPAKAVLVYDIELIELK
ncbi:MAG: FKBP-type peptidyl-prolyl cis-trans isomerase [Chlorobi bacterium]|nr:FKBP-type peptidyl-prolyl cis-trans isomerase [Chlorobiota bacterium]